MKKLCMGAAACLIAVSLFAQNAGNSDKMTPPQGGTAPGLPGQMPPDGFGTVPDEQAPELAAAVVVNKVNSGKTLGAEDFRTAKPDESVLLVKDGASAKALKTLFDKAGGNVSNGGQSNFYGLNAAVVTQNGSSLTLQNVTVTTDADGANAVFSTGEGSVITIKNIRIHTHKDSSRGLDATYGGMITADKVDITTEGAHCAAFATDRGEGTVMVKGGSARTAGEGSPVIYSTGAISVSNLTGSASGSEIAVIEGKNSISIEKSRLTGGRSREWGKDVNAAVMLYQSLSGDANQGTSLFSATDSVLTSTASGPFFYVTNTNAEIRLSRTRLINPNEVLIQATGNESERGWGRKGANGGTLKFKSENQILEGSICVDEISSASLYFNEGTEFTGSINSEKQGKVNLYLEKNASISLTADAYVNVLSLADKKGKNILSNGYTIYYNKNAKENKWLHGKTIKLKDGGKLVGIEMKFKEAKSAGGEFDFRQRPPTPPNGNPPSGTPSQHM